MSNLKIKASFENPYGMFHEITQVGNFLYGFYPLTKNNLQYFKVGVVHLSLQKKKELIWEEVPQLEFVGNQIQAKHLKAPNGKDYLYVLVTAFTDNKEAVSVLYRYTVIQEGLEIKLDHGITVSKFSLRYPQLVVSEDTLYLFGVYPDKLTEIRAFICDRTATHFTDVGVLCTTDSASSCAKIVSCVDSFFVIDTVKGDGTGQVTQYEGNFLYKGFLVSGSCAIKKFTKPVIVPFEARRVIDVWVSVNGVYVATVVRDRLKVVLYELGHVHGGPVSGTVVGEGSGIMHLNPCGFVHGDKYLLVGRQAVNGVTLVQVVDLLKPEPFDANKILTYPVDKLVPPLGGKNRRFTLPTSTKLPTAELDTQTPVGSAGFTGEVGGEPVSPSQGLEYKKKYEELMDLVEKVVMAKLYDADMSSSLSDLFAFYVNARKK